MQTPRGILVFGANGSGKTTLARAVARVLDCKHMDIEMYRFAESSIPYTKERPREDCLRLMRVDIEKYGLFVLSAVTGDFGGGIEPFYALAVHITAPKELRMARIAERAYAQHGERVRPGGDMAEGHARFMDFAASRDLSRIDKWAETLDCPIMQVDGAIDWSVNAARIATRFRAI